MNSFDAFAKSQKTPKLGSHSYYPGGSFGGPLPLPLTQYNKKRDKLFFWNGIDFYRQLGDGGVARAMVPTDRMRAGDFSADALKGLRNQGLASTVPQLDTTQNWYKWYTANTPGYNCTITAGVLSSGCMTAAGKNYLNLYPHPNADPTQHDGYNYVVGTLASDNSWQDVSRVDWSISDNTKVFVRYSAQREQNHQPMGVWGGTCAVAVGVYSEAAAIILKSPATIFSIPGIFPLVPGIAAYTTVQYIAENKLASAANEAITTAASAGAIAFGIMVVYAVFRYSSRIRKLRNRFNKLKKL
jgi:uncharacterized membrane protein YjjB (DUF3815 family)